MKQKFSALAVDLIVLILFSVIVFVVPIPKTGVFWISYLFAVLAVVSQLGFVYVAFSGGTSARSRFYGFPVFRVGLLYLCAQMVLSIVFMLVGKWVAPWIPFLLYVVLLGLAATGLIATDNARDGIHLVEEKQADGTLMIRVLRRDTEAMKVTYPELTELYELLRYANPVSTAATEEMEQRLSEMLGSYQQLPDEATRIRVKNQMVDLLKQRNAVCKSSKTR